MVKRAGRICLVVNADDFGLSTEVNRGIMRAHEEGIVTSASLMVRAGAAAEAARYAASHHDLSPGLHVDLGEWSYGDGSWPPVTRWSISRTDQRFETRWNASWPGSAISWVARLLSIRTACAPPRAGVAIWPAWRRRSGPLQVSGGALLWRLLRADGGRHAAPGAISVESLLRILASLPRQRDRLACHPGLANDLATMYSSEREAELAVLCDPRVREAITALGIELCSFDRIARCRAEIGR
jgi:hypothetical protein